MSEAPGGPGRPLPVRTVLLAVSALLFAGYALPLFAPPAPMPPLPPAPEAPLLARLFPGVPPLWVALRLASLLGAVALAAYALGPVDPLRWPPRRTAVRPLPRAALVVALAAALAHAGAALVVERLDRLGQSLYFAWLFVPALVLAIGEWRARAPRAAARTRGLAPGLAVAAVLGLWLATRLPDLIVPLRAADLVDTWLSHEWLERAASDGRNLLTEGFLPGLTGIYMFLQGVSFLGPGPLDFAWLQGVHVFWCLVAGAAIGALAGRLVDPWSAPVAAAAFLFAPFVLLQPLAPAPYVLGPLFTVALALLVVAVHEHGSSAALAAVGAIAGIAATSHPPLVPVAGLAVLAAAAAARRAPALPAPVLAIAGLTLVAAALPALPDLETLRAMRDEFTRARGHWAGLEAVLLGQRDPFDVQVLWEAGRPGWLDIPLASLLAPFAVPRTSLRAFGDALFDPVSAGLAGLAIVLALRTAPRSRAARALLAVLAIGILPAFASSYDRPSHTRLFVAQVPLAILAAAGLAALRGALGARPARIALAGTLAIATAGALLFDVVGPRIVASSSVGIAARSLHAATPAGGSLLLVFPGPADLSWLHEERIARAVAPGLLHVVPFTGIDALLAGPGSALPQAELFFFSPGLEARRGVAATVCARWPDAAFFELRDRAGLSRVYAARPAGAGWRPAGASGVLDCRALRNGARGTAPDD